MINSVVKFIEFKESENSVKQVKLRTKLHFEKKVCDFD